MQRMALLGIAALVLGGGFFHVLREGAERERLERRLQALQAEVDALQAVLDAQPSRQSATLSGSTAGRPRSNPLDRPTGSTAPSPTPRDPHASALATPNPPGQQGRAAATATQAELLELLESHDPSVRERMRRVVAEHEQDLRDEERERRQAAWEERTNKRLESLARDASLSPQQVDALFGILTAHRDRSGEAFRAARETHDFGQAEQQVEQSEKQADDEARALLDAKQFAAYKTMRDEDAARRGWGPRGAPPARPAPER